MNPTTTTTPSKTWGRSSVRAPDPGRRPSPASRARACRASPAAADTASQTWHRTWAVVNGVAAVVFLGALGS